MDALVPLLVLLTIDLLAIRFGADSRPGLRSKEHDLALTGMTWEKEIRPPVGCTSPSGPNQCDDAKPEGSSVQAVIWISTPGVQEATDAHKFPTLGPLDLALGPFHAPFATVPDAPFLEERARALMKEIWTGGE